MSIEDADEKQIQLANELKDMSIGKRPVLKSSFLKNRGFIISLREKFLINKAKYFPQKVLNQHLN